MALSSNEKRAQMRQDCRQALAAHIYERLGLRVDPRQVRLQPSTDDGYSWSVTDSQRYLLQSSLSRGTVGLYRAICEELGRSLEAVMPQAMHSSQTDIDVDRIKGKYTSVQDPGHESFTSTIQRLKSVNCELVAQLENARDQLDEAENDNTRWKTHSHRLSEDLKSSRDLVNRLENDLAQMRADIDRVILVLQDHRPHEDSPLCN